MSRPKVCRCVKFRCKCNLFSPKCASKDEIIINKDEFEAVRLKDFECFDQDKSAKKMKISQPTFFRILDSARKKIAEALIKGKAIRIGEE